MPGHLPRPDRQLTASERQSGRATRVDVLFVLMALTTGVVLLYLGRGLTFWDDEWRSITFDGGPIDYLRPVNEHWSTFHLLLYRATFGLVGLRTYAPYLAEVVVLHLLAVAGAYVLMRPRVGPLLAALVAVPLLFLGSGAENLFWGFQTGFVGSVMFGVWALFFIERRSRRAPLVASLLLIASLASSGMGLFFLVVVAGRTLADSSLRKRALAVVPPAAVYLLWFGLVGRDGVGTGGPLSVDLSTARFAIRGIVHSTQRIVGLDHLPDGHLWGLLLFLGLSVATAYRIVRGRTPALAAGCLLGVITMYTVIAFVRLRADPGYDHATSSRFVYVAAFLLVLAIVDLLPERHTWSVRGSGRGAAVLAALALGLVAATVANVDALFEARAEFQRSTERTRAFVSVALTHANAPWVDRDAPRGWLPAVEELERTVASHGSPLRDALFPGEVRAPGAAAREVALLALIGEGFRVEQAQGRRDLVRVGFAEPSGVGIVRDGRCVLVHSKPTATAWIRNVPPGARVRVRSSSQLAGGMHLAHERGPERRIYAELEPGAARDVVIPDVGDGRLWTLGVDLPMETAAVKLCVLAADGDRLVREPRVTVRYSQ